MLVLTHKVLYGHGQGDNPLHPEPDWLLRLGRQGGHLQVLPTDARAEGTYSSIQFPLSSILPITI